MFSFHGARRGVLTDHFTKYTEVLAVPNQTAEECAKRLMNDVIARWGAPLSLHSDQGAAFESRVFQELCRTLEIKKTRSSARNPKGNGQVERNNRTLLKMIKAFLKGEQSDWDQHLGCLAGAYRATPHEATRLSPNMMTLGREVRLPADMMFPDLNPNSSEQEDTCTYVLNLRETMRRAHGVARKHLASKAKRSE